jgi:hypothetical protein
MVYLQIPCDRDSEENVKEDTSRRDPWASPPRAGGFQVAEPRALRSAQRFRHAGPGLSVRDFWAWAFGDLATNTIDAFCRPSARG